MKKLIEARQTIQEVFGNPYAYRLATHPGVRPRWQAEWRTASGSDGMLRVLPMGGGMYVTDFLIDGQNTMTGEGDAFRILATVLTALREVLSSEAGRASIKVLLFSASRYDKGRVKLYRRLIRKMAQSVNMTSEMSKDPGWATFTLTRTS